MKMFVPATILAENSNALNCAFSSYTPSIQNGPFIPGGTSFADAFTKFSAIVYTSSNNDSLKTSGLFPITLKDGTFFDFNCCSDGILPRPSISDSCL